MSRLPPLPTLRRARLRGTISRSGYRAGDATISAWPLHVALLGLSLLLFVAGCESRGCGRRPGAATDERRASVERPTRDTGGASGDAGPSSKDEVLVRRSEELPTRPGRIISMAPNLTETLFALGAGDRVVGVTKFCDWPEAVDEIPEVGGFVDPNFEKILSLRPDLVVGTVGGGDPRMAERLDEAGLPYAYWRMSSIPETLATIEGLADVVGASERGAQLVAEMREGLAPREPPSGGRPEVLFVLGHDPLVVAGPGSLLDELIARAGGTNAIESGAGTYPRLDIERVLALDPDIIMDASMTGRQRDAASFWERYDSLTAVRDRGVVTFEDPVLLRPGPRLPRALELIREAM